MSPKRWHQLLDFGDEESFVRVIEDSSREELASEITRRLDKKTDEDGFYLAAARAAIRSTRYEGLGSGRVPIGLFCLHAHRELGSRLPPDLRPYPLYAAASYVHAEIRDPAFGPALLLRFAPYTNGSREEIRDAYLEALLLGEIDLADHLFAWLVRNLAPEEVADLLWTGGLERVGLGSFKLTGSLESYLLVQQLGWDHGAELLRAVVRHQAYRIVGENPYPVCRDRIVAENLHEKSRRRLPGQRGRGEDDPAGIWTTAIQWGKSSAEERTVLAARCLAGEWTLEDYWEAVSLGAAILFLGASSAGVPVAQAARLVIATQGLRAMLRHGHLGQKILASLLVGRTPEFAAVDESWVEAGVRLLESSLRASKVSLDELGAALDGWQAEAAIGCIASASANPEELEGVIPVIDQRLAFLLGLEGIGPLFHQGQVEAFQSARSVHRWIHIACSAWLSAVWPHRGLIEERALAELADRRRKSLARRGRSR